MFAFSCVLDAACTSFTWVKDAASASYLQCRTYRLNLCSHADVREPTTETDFCKHMCIALVSCPKQPSALLFPFPQAWRGVANLQGAPPPSFALSRPARTFWTRRSLLITCKSVGLPFDGTMDLIGAESMPACVPCSKIRSFLISPSSFLTLPRAALRCPADARTRADRLLGDAGSYVTGLELGDAANDVSSLNSLCERGS